MVPTSFPEERVRPSLAARAAAAAYPGRNRAFASSDAVCFVSAAARVAMDAVSRAREPATSCLCSASSSVSAEGAPGDARACGSKGRGPCA